VSTPAESSQEERAARLGEHLADRARVAFLLADLARLKAREHAVCEELAQLLRQPGAQTASQDLCSLLDRLTKESCS
jgi:hypothetical protein